MILNPFDTFSRELLEMNENLCNKLDTIIKRLDTLIAIQDNQWYGDGK